MVQRVADACGIECVADIASLDDAFPKSAHIHVYRIVQESLNNVMKHSKARRAAVTISRHGRSVAIRIEDNGVGLRPDALGVEPSTTSGFGLKGIRERARILGGRVDIRSGGGTGTSVTITFTAEDATHE
jgi:two-component system sensor histidine kinase DegS